MALDPKPQVASLSVKLLESQERLPVMKKQRILQEDAYVKAVDEIIERDYFPDLPKMKLNKDYLEAMESNDVEKIRQIELELHRDADTTLEQQGHGCATPSVTENLYGGTTGQKKSELRLDDSKVDISKSTLDNFLTKNTSEDNASFELIMEDARKKHHEKFSWLYEKQNEQDEKQLSYLCLPAPDDNLDPLEGKPLNLETWTYKPKNTLMYVPDGVDFSQEELIEKSKKKGQEIVQKNTRFTENPFNSDSSKFLMLQAAKEHSVALKALGKVGVDGKVEHSEDSPQVNGYGFIATPSPAPGVDASPLMTWGEIEGTPMRLDATPHRDASATPGPTFKIPDAPRREKLGHALAEKVGKQYREKRQKAVARAAATLGRSPSRFTVDRQGTLSPAAQKLLKSSIRVSSDRALRSSYSPSPRTRTPGSTTPSARVTPKSARTPTPRSSQAEVAPSLTDDLLQLPRA